MEDTDLIADISLYATARGGRRTPTPAKRLGCIFVFDDHQHDCLLILETIGRLSPGASATLPIIFLYPDLIVPLLRKGDAFLLKELSIIGEGKVREIFYDERRQHATDVPDSSSDSAE